MLNLIFSSDNEIGNKGGYVKKVNMKKHFCHLTKVPKGVILMTAK